jgi:hypothetical protein
MGVMVFVLVALARQRPPDDECEQQKRKNAFENEPDHVYRAVELNVVSLGSGIAELRC